MTIFVLWFAFQQPAIPSYLEPWRDWVLYGHEQAQCPSYYQAPNQKICAWPSRLSILASQNNGSFTQEWAVYARGWLPLPGSERLWPMDVTVDGRPVTVLNRENRPAVYVEAGTHRVAGTWRWPGPPTAIPIPPESGLIRLRVGGREIDAPRRDQAGTVWLQAPESGGPSEVDRVGLRVFRLVQDRVPTFLHTRLELEVSGKNRELDLGQPLLEGFNPHALRSELPVRLDENGTLLAQVRAGSWVIELDARSEAVTDQLNLETRETPWPGQELWAFEARRDLRVVAFSGVQSVDPSQTDLPQAWRAFPCFLVRPGESLRLEERLRGMERGGLDRLELSRILWLNFNGDGWTFQDQMSGELNQHWRLSLAPPYELGHLSLNGEDQLITVLGDPPLPGTEIREKSVTLEGEGQIGTRASQIPVVGWSANVENPNVTLHLPPGWRLFAVLGPDRIDGDWLHSWRLWDFFWVLLLSLATAKLWRKSYGVVMLVALMLFHGHEAAPNLLWASLFAAIALQRLLPDGWLKRMVAWWRWSSFGFLVFWTLVFILGQVQFILYPQLTDSSWGGAGMVLGAKEALRYEEPAAAPEEKAARINLYEDTAQAQIQTGPGIPRWTGVHSQERWANYSGKLYWSGPVGPDESYRLFLFPPLLNKIMALIRVVLVLWLLWIVLERGLPNIPWLKRWGPAATGCFLLGILPVRAQEPSQALLDDLRQRLLRPAACYPHCAEIPSAAISMRTQDQLEIVLEVHAGAPVGVPMPGHPFEVLIGNKPAEALYLDGNGVLWTLVSPGIQEIRLTIDARGKETVRILFPLKPHRASFSSSGDWQVSGLHRDGATDAQLAFHRIREQEQRTHAGGLSPFGTVERTLIMHHEWRVRTRISNENIMPFIAEVPLLPGEKVITPEIRVQDQKVMVNLTAGAAKFWESVIEPVSRLDFKAPGNVPWVEVWKLQASQRWHVTWEGTPVIGHFHEDGGWRPFWVPRPDEMLALQTSRPPPAEGQTLTIDQTNLRVDPGSRSTLFTLNMNVRTSLGGEHGIRLPEDTVLKSMSIDGNTEPARLEDGKLILPLKPGSQRIVLEGFTQGGIRSLFHVPRINLEHPSVNHNTELNLPTDRWLLWAHGPLMGPSVRFWSILVTLILVALALGRVGGTPLKTHHWLLLGLGLSQLHILAAAVVASWFFLLQWRTKLTIDREKYLRFDFMQLVIVGWTLVSFILLLIAVHEGLLGMPHMYVAGPLGSGSWLVWYQERAAQALPDIWALSVPVWVFRMLMLAWALWLALQLIRWLRWGWQCFSTHRLWLWKPRVVTSSPGEAKRSGDVFESKSS